MMTRTSNDTSRVSIHMRSWSDINGVHASMPTIGTWIQEERNCWQYLEVLYYTRISGVMM